MKRYNLEKLWASVFVLAMILAGTVTVTAFPKEMVPVRPHPHHYPVWANENWDEQYSMKIAVDSQDNLITVGSDELGNGMITKMSRDTGEILWNTIPESLYAQPLPIMGGDGMPPLWYTMHPYDSVLYPMSSQYSVMMCDVAVDPQDNIFCTAEVYDLSNPDLPTSDAYVFKLNGDTGEQLWFRQIDVSMYDSYLSVTVDSEGYPYVSGFSGGLTPIPHLDTWIAKLAKNDIFQGQPILWKHIAYQNPSPWYTHIDHDNQNHVYVTGCLVSVQWSSDYGAIQSMQTIVDKYDCTFLTSEGRYMADYSVDTIALSVAVKSDIVAVAGVYDINETQGPQKQLIVKLNSSNLGRDWYRYADNNGYFLDVAIWNHKNTDYVVATGYKEHVNKFFTAIYNAVNGAPYYSFTEEGTIPNNLAWSYGVVVDSEQHIIITGQEYASIDGQSYYGGLTIKNLVTEEIPLMQVIAEPLSGESTPEVA
jgi:hypothetical protein